MRSICVYCGSSPGRRPEYLEVAGVLARLLVANGIGLVYGGGRVGVMGTLADAVMAAGGEVTGIIPQDFVDKEVAHGGPGSSKTEISLSRTALRRSQRRHTLACLKQGIKQQQLVIDSLQLLQYPPPMCHKSL